MKQILYFHLDLDTHWSSNDTKHVSCEIDSWLGTFTEDSSTLLDIVKTPYTPQQGDKIYFLPEVSVPRVKFKNVSLEYGIKTVRNIKEANVFFGCSKSTHHMTINKWPYKLPTSELKEFMQLIDHRFDAHTRDKIETALEFYENEEVAISWTVANNVNGAIANSKCSKYSHRVVIVDDQYKEEYEHLQSITIYDESCVIDILNGEDAAVIDKDMFEHLGEMFKSSDRDNHVLAMEIMANSKYTESLIYLELLFHNYSNRIMDIHSKNHVNFKSLVSYLGKNMRSLYTDLDDIGDSLLNKGQFTTDKLEILMEHLSSEIQNRGDSKYFTVKTITVHPDHIATLGSNYTYTVQDDYVGPEMPIEFEEEEERVADLEDDELNEFIGEIIDEIEESLEMHPITEEELAHDLYGVDNDNIEVTLKTELLSNNHQITQTNESTDIDWF
jgi:hypothetical protein